MPDKRIEEFYNSDCFSLIGMSKKSNNFAWGVYKSFNGAGRKVYALHPNGGEKNGVRFYTNFRELPDRPDACIVCTDLKKNKNLISELADSGIKRFWFQWGSYDKDVLEEAGKYDIVPLTGCVLMYMPESSFLHKVHRFFYEIFKKGKD